MGLLTISTGGTGVDEYPDGIPVKPGRYALTARPGVALSGSIAFNLKSPLTPSDPGVDLLDPDGAPISLDIAAGEGWEVVFSDHDLLVPTITGASPGDTVNLNVTLLE